MWRGLAEVAEKYVRKGNKLYIEGKIRNRSYGEENNKKYITEIIADNMIMLSGGPGAGGAGASAGKTGFANKASLGGKASVPEAVPTVDLGADAPKAGKSKKPATVSVGAGKSDDTKEETINIEDIPF